MQQIKSEYRYFAKQWSSLFDESAFIHFMKFMHILYQIYIAVMKLHEFEFITYVQN